MNKLSKCYTKLEIIEPESIYSYLSKNNLLNKYIDILLIKPSDVKYYFVRSDGITTSIKNNDLTILEGFAVEQSDLETKPKCLTQSEYELIPTEYKGFNYNIYYEKNPFIVDINYKTVDNTQKHLASFNSQRVVHMYTMISNIEDIKNLINFIPSAIFIS